MKILEELLYGNDTPLKRSSKKYSRVEHALALVIHYKTMRAILSNTQKEQYEKLLTARVNCPIYWSEKHLSKGFV